MTTDDLTPGTPRPARVTTTHPVEARSVEYGHEPCPHCPGRTTVVYVHGWRTDDGVVDRLRAVVGESHSGQCPFRPDAPQPAATGNSAFPVADDAVERAARAWHEEAEQDSGGFGMGAWEAIGSESRAQALRRMRAALAAAGGPDYSEPVALWQDDDEPPVCGGCGRADGTHAGAGAAVDREALAAAIWPEAFDLRGVRDADGEPMTQEAQAQARATAARVLTFLATRGDATPTEVEWGVRYTAPKGKQRITRTDRQDDAEGVAAVTGGDVMQRTVSAWREVEGGEQRG